LSNQDIAKSPGKLFVVSAPSGAGKTSLCNRLIKKYPDLKYSISHTTRKPRKNEEDGKDYFFVDENQFNQMIENGDFIEWAVVHENYYGTSADFIKQQLKNGYDVILDIDPQGARILRKKLGYGVYIFIVASSLKELENRLKKRRSESEEKINKRLQNAIKEVRYYKNYDYLILNDNYNKAFYELECIFVAEHLKTSEIENIEDIMKLEV